MLKMKPMFHLKCLASQFLVKNSVPQVICRNLNSKKTDTKEGAVNVFSIEDDIDEEEIKAREAAIEKKRNKSELYPSDYNVQHGRPPYAEPEWEHHESLRYRRRLYGKYGEMSKVNPSILWPSKVELDYMKEYEKVAQPFTFETLTEKAREKKALKEKRIQEEEDKILEKVKNVKFEILKFHKRIAAQKQRALEIIEKKNELIKRVRKHFGYEIDVKDSRFKEMFEKLQKEERKKLKLEKKVQAQKYKTVVIQEETKNEEINRN